VPAEMLARHARVPGVIGQVRWYEDCGPELLISQGGELVTMTLRSGE